MSPLLVLVTSPRLPAGQLTGAAWRALFVADEVASYDDASPTVRALGAEGIRVQVLADATPLSLLERAADKRLVWVASDDGDEQLLHALADDIVSRAEQGRPPSEVEILVGSFDPVGARLLDLVQVVDRLRMECPWDRTQTHESLVRYLVEETYETVEAIESGDHPEMQEELGDLLLQVVLHARVATEHGDTPFGIDDVAAGIVEKLIRRHPHVFGDDSAIDADEVQSRWQDIKAAEKVRTSAFDGIPAALPALSLAEKVISRSPPKNPEPGSASSTATVESLGEALFALAEAAHAAGIDPEQALRARVRAEMAHVQVQEQRATRVDLGQPG